MLVRMGTCTATSVGPRLHGREIRTQHHDFFHLHIAFGRIFSNVLHVCVLLGTGKDIQRIIFLDCNTGEADQIFFSEFNFKENF